MNIKNNLRFQETEQKIQQTLLKILKSKNFDKVTVREICSDAQINRSTFYAHYLDVYDLIEKTESSLHKELASSFADGSIDTDNFLNSTYLTIFLQHIYDNKNFYRVCLKTRKSYPIQQGFEHIFNAIVKPYCEKTGLKSQNEMMYFFVYFQAGFTTMLKRWVENDFQESPDELAEIMCKCMSNGVLS